MKKIRYFKCLKGHYTEKLVEDDMMVTVCDDCNQTSKRQLSAPRCFSNTTGGSPSSNYTKPR